MGHQQDRLSGKLALDPKIEKVGSQSLCGQNIERGKRFIHEEQDRLDHNRAGKADPLAHPSRKFARISGLEAVKSDQIDCRHCLAASLGASQSHRVKARLHILEDSKPGK